MFLADVMKLPLEDFWVVETDICVCETALLPLMSLCNPLECFSYPFILLFFSFVSLTAVFLAFHLIRKAWLTNPWVCVWLLRVQLMVLS